MTQDSSTLPTHSHIDVSACAREAIRIPGAIQPHGFLIGIDIKSAHILVVSNNLQSYLGKHSEEVLKQPLQLALGGENAKSLLQAASTVEENFSYLGIVNCNGRCFDTTTYIRDGLRIFEFEPCERESEANFQPMYRVLNNFLSALNDIDSVESMSITAVRQIKKLTGFGRVMIYRFDEEGHGEVIAEELDPGYHSYMRQRFPATDIPAQARELYVTNRLRLIANADYKPSRLLTASDPLTAKPIDLTHSSLRSVSPVHLQYMRNMGTMASMSASLVIQGKLWGLISCHHHEPRFVPFEVRAACEQLGQILALRIESFEEGSENRHRLELRRLLVSILAGLSQGADFVANMQAMHTDVLRFASATGVALAFENQLVLFGDTPGRPQIADLITWLDTNGNNTVFHTNALSSVYPPGAEISHDASGVLALPISQIHRHYLIWFRPEVVRTIEWAGDPHEKHTDANMPGMLTPRRSFDTWRETVRGTSQPWRSSEVEIALEFRSALLGIVLGRAEQMADMAEELGRANKELESFSYSVSHDLRAPLRHIVGFSDLLLEMESAQLSERGSRFVRNIKDSARFAGKLVDDLLSFSQMGRASLRPAAVDMNSLVALTIEKLEDEFKGRQVKWHIADLPTINADPMFINLALHNLLANAIKYTSTREIAEISVLAEQEHDGNVFHVSDNGVGFNMEYVHKLFGVFQRLHRMEEFQGTGIGLANVKRIIERHGGRVWANGEINKGATFSFFVPNTLPEG